MKVERCPIVIVACAVLHNIGIELNEDFFLPDAVEDQIDDPLIINVNDALGNSVRRRIVRDFFRKSIMMVYHGASVAIAVFEINRRIN